MAEILLTSPLCQQLAAVLIVGFGPILSVRVYTWKQFARATVQ